MKKQNDICEETCLHKEVTEPLKNKLLAEDEVNNVAEIFKILGDGTRIRIIDALFHNELCVCDIADILKMSQSAISHQLRLMRTTRILKQRKEGKNVYYSLEDQHIKDILGQCINHIKHN